MKKKLVSTLLCVAMLGTMIAGCGSDGSKADSNSSDAAVVDESSEVSDKLAEEIKAQVPDKEYSEYTIGFCGMTLNNEYHIIVANSVAQSGKALGMKVEIQAGAEHQSVEEQLTIIENFVSQGVDGIILVPAASEGLISALQECKDAGIDRKSVG